LGLVGGKVEVNEVVIIEIGGGYSRPIIKVDIVENIELWGGGYGILEVDPGFSYRFRNKKCCCMFFRRTRKKK